MSSSSSRTYMNGAKLLASPARGARLHKKAALEAAQGLDLSALAAGALPPPRQAVKRRRSPGGSGLKPSPGKSARTQSPGASPRPDADPSALPAGFGPPSDPSLLFPLPRPGLGSPLGAGEHLGLLGEQQRLALMCYVNYCRSAAAAAAAAGDSGTPGAPRAKEAGAPVPEGAALPPRSSSTSAAADSPGESAPRHTSSVSSSEEQNDSDHAPCKQRGRRNYKNMTRERRIEANARERTRVHTIGAAFETLRQTVPAYSNNQKLSKLAILRIACSYILSLSRLADLDYSADQSQPDFTQCMNQLTQTIQTEGKMRRS